MLSLPVEYAVDKQFQISTFMTAELTPKEKKRFKDSVLSIKLEYQIAGEAVPSLINDQYDCQAILFFDIKLNSLKYAAFVSEIVQKLVKPLCVVRCSASGDMQVYSMAHKRLNQQDRTQIVIEDMFLTSSVSSQFSDEAETLLADYVDFDKLINKSNKMSMYMEMMTKAYIISYSSLWSRSKALLVSKAWYNVEDVLSIFNQYKRIVQLQNDKKAAKTVSEQAKINSELKAIFSILNQYTDKQ
jgi:hypothetical protein